MQQQFCYHQVTYNQGCNFHWGQWNIYFRGLLHVLENFLLENKTLLFPPVFRLWSNLQMLSVASVAHMGVKSTIAWLLSGLQKWTFCVCVRIFAVYEEGSRRLSCVRRVHGLVVNRQDISLLYILTWAHSDTPEIQLRIWKIVQSNICRRCSHKTPSGKVQENGIWTVFI